MATNFTSGYLQEVFTFPFRDPQWKKKIGLSALFIFGGVVIFSMFFFAGYCFRMMRSMIVEEQPPALPEWGDWGVLFKDGVKVVGLYAIVYLPALVLMLVSYFFLMAPALVQPTSDELIFYFFPLLGMPGMAIGAIINFVVQVFFPIAVCHMVAKNTFSAAFRIREWWAVLRANLSGFLVSFGIMLGISVLSSFVLQIAMGLCCLLPIVSSLLYAYMYLVGSALYAQVYCEAIAQE